jgi:hypothetical protein
VLNNNTDEQHLLSGLNRLNRFFVRFFENPIHNTFGIPKQVGACLEKKKIEVEF